MQPKTINTLYWVFTGLFSLLMIFSAVGGLQPSQDAIKLIHDQLGYPVYFIPFISFAKLFGSIAILVPSFKRIKEWAYSGLFFDLTAATYSGIVSAGKFDPLMIAMLIWIIPGVLSYVLLHKRTRYEISNALAAPCL